MADGKLLEIWVYSPLSLNKSDITGIIFEPWHYRYVGKEAAKEIYEQDITLEEYLGAEPVGEASAIESDSEESSAE